ncbi:hypothetical protein RIF29_40142 [Crotalaria pallida]|uniref:Uncharacterized protein n=1 Tax=Crotalaria pallida TaxID=3830 RepID=A0AAN9E5L0_CROPI
MVVIDGILMLEEIVNRDGKSSLFSLVKAFEPVLAVYEEFCNLKQVELKLKNCRGSSVRKILVREANAYSATHVIVRIPQSLHKIRPGTTVAKCCARKLSKECWVLAVNNGKVVFMRDGPPATCTDLKGIGFDDRKGLLGSIHKTLNKSSKVLNNDDSSSQNSDHTLAKVFLDTTESIKEKSCSNCGPASVLPNSSHIRNAEESFTDGGAKKKNSLAIVHVQMLLVQDLNNNWVLQILHHDLEDKVNFNGGGNVMTLLAYATVGLTLNINACCLNP